MKWRERNKPFQSVGFATKKRRCCWSGQFVCLLAHRGSHTPSLLFMFFFSSNQQVCVAYLTYAHLDVCYSWPPPHDDGCATAVLHRLPTTQTQQTHIHTCGHIALKRSSVLFHAWNRSFFAHMFSMLYRLLQATHILSHTQTHSHTYKYVRTATTFRAVKRLLAYLFVILLAPSVSQTCYSFCCALVCLAI